jgi:cytochrome c oxidase cbb3-type subunit 2
MIRPFRAETERYGHYSVAGEYVYDHPFQWGSKRTGPDLHRVGGRYSDEWQRAHLINPRDVVPESNMPAFAFLANVKAKDYRWCRHREEDAGHAWLCQRSWYSDLH